MSLPVYIITADDPIDVVEFIGEINYQMERAEMRPAALMLRIAHESEPKATQKPVQSYWPGLTPQGYFLGAVPLQALIGQTSCYCDYNTCQQIVLK